MADESQVVNQRQPLTVKFSTLGKGSEAAGGGEDAGNKEHKGGEDFEVDFEIENEKPKPDPKETPAEKVVREKKEKETPAEAKLNFDRYSKYGKGYTQKEKLETEDDLDEIITARDKRIAQLETIAKGNTKLKDDKDYQGWKSWVSAKDEDLVQASLVYEFISDGTPEDVATTKAKARIEKNKENTEWLEDSARGVRKSLKASMAERELQYQKEFENASKDITFVEPNEDFEKNIKKELLTKDNFLGMKLPSDAKEREKRLNGAYIAPTQMQELLKDPATYNKVSLFLKYEKQWEANIKSRTNGKAEVLNKFPKTPPKGSQSTRTVERTGEAGKKFNGDAWLGRKAS